MFQFFKLRGLPVGLAAVAKGLGIGMNKTMDAAKVVDFTRKHTANVYQL